MINKFIIPKVKIKIILLFFILNLGLIYSSSIDPDNNRYIKLIYNNFEKGKIVENSDFTMIYDKIDNLLFSTDTNSKISSYTNFLSNENVKIITYNDILYKKTKSLDSLYKPKFGIKENDKILGFKCKYASFKSFSNHIETWYTEETEVKGSPYRSYLPLKTALVLKITVNGGRVFQLTSISNDIDLNKDVLPHKFDFDKIKELSSSEFEEIKIKSRFLNINIFKDDIINWQSKYSFPDIDKAIFDSVYHFANGNVILKKIKLPIDLLKNGAQVFAKLTNSSNGDAYDRTGSLFIIPENNELGRNSIIDAFKKLDKDSIIIDKDILSIYKGNNKKIFYGLARDKSYDCPIEVMRYITSFGAGYFNNIRPINNYNWSKEVVYKQEITHLIPDNIENIWVGVLVGNYDKGGHKISLDFTFHPTFEDNMNYTRWIEPLFNTIDIFRTFSNHTGSLFKTDTVRIAFSIPKNIENPQLVYTPTGHGGWGDGDEFNQRLNEIFIDGKRIFNVIPWRTDCSTYRMSNPASGNFKNGLSSSDFSRSNWCPGAVTPPYFIPLDKLKRDVEHSFEFVIHQGDNKGGSNSWTVFAALIGNEKL